MRQKCVSAVVAGVDDEVPNFGIGTTTNKNKNKIKMNMNMNIIHLHNVVDVTDDAYKIIEAVIEAEAVIVVVVVVVAVVAVVEVVVTSV